MLKQDFDKEYEKLFSDRCPNGESIQHKVLECFLKLEKRGISSSIKKCKSCWWGYLNLQEPKVEPKIENGLFD